MNTNTNTDTNTNNTNNTTKFKKVWVFQGSVLGKGRPSKQVFAERKRVLVPVGETYDPKKHTSVIN